MEDRGTERQRDIETDRETVRLTRDYRQNSTFTDFVRR